jgi:electron transport complex protein RnfE
MNRGIIGDAAKNGLWNNNPALVQLLGLCPLLAVSNKVVNGLGFGIVTLVVMLGSNITVSLVRRHINHVIRLPVFVLITGTWVTCAELLMKAFTYEYYQAIGIFVPLIVANSAILGRAEDFASRQPVAIAALDGLMMGTGFLIALLLVGGTRELLGHGTLLADMHLLFGPDASTWTIKPFGNDYRFLIFVLPPGAFAILGFLIAIKNAIDRRIEGNATTLTTLEKGTKRVRTTEYSSAR